MTHTKLGRGVLLFAISIVGVEPLHTTTVRTTQSDGPTARSTRPADDLKGTWSGTFQSSHADLASFTITVIIDSDSH